MRTQTINKIIADNEYKSYLEIGLGDGGNFRNIKVKEKFGVDPEINNIHRDVYTMKSDDYFLENDHKYDLIFIDGLHEADQVERDIINSYKALNKGGMILLHDVNPPSEKAQRVPREQVQWTGDVWRAVVGFKNEYGDKIKTGYFNDTYGLFAIYKTGRYAVREGFTDDKMTYQDFEKNKSKLLGI